MTNQDKISALGKAVAEIKTLAADSRILAVDNSPDGANTVAEDFAIIVRELELPFLQMLESLDHAPGTATDMELKKAYSIVKKTGDFYVWSDKTKITLLIPGDSEPITLPLGDGGWKLSGPDDAPSLTPSIFRNPPTGYHGFFTDGKFTENLTPAPAPGTVSAPAPSINRPSPMHVLDDGGNWVLPEPKAPTIATPPEIDSNAPAPAARAMPHAVEPEPHNPRPRRMAGSF